MEKLLIFVGMALVTYFTRYTMIAALGRDMALPLRRWLGYVPPAVLSALIAPAALAPRGHLEIGPHVWATLAGAAVAWRTRNVLLTILGGMAVFWLLRAFGA
jgi:branched-subunit amino acid transport protein